MNKEKLFGPIHRIVQDDVASIVLTGEAFQKSNQSALNPSRIATVEVPEEDINTHSFDRNFTVIHFIVIITYVNDNRISFPGIANFKINKGSYPDPDEFESVYNIDVTRPMII